MNDPVGIALLIGMVELATHADATFWVVVEEFVVEMAVGLAFGLVGGALLLPIMRRVSLPSEGLYPLRTLAARRASIYGAASIAHGSGFLAVFVAGVMIGDARAPFKAEIERFHGVARQPGRDRGLRRARASRSTSRELVTSSTLWEGILLALALAFVARPLVIAAAARARTTLRRGEKLFLMWGGLKGAVPDPAGRARPALERRRGATASTRSIFVVVAFSVLVQGSTVPWAARRLGVRMRMRQPEPWRLTIDLPKEPGDLHRVRVAAGSHAAGGRSTSCRSASTAGSSPSSATARSCDPAARRSSQPRDEVVVSPQLGRRPRRAPPVRRTGLAGDVIALVPLVAAAAVAGPPR